MTLAVVLLALAAAYSMLRAYHLAGDLRRVSAELDQAHLTGVTVTEQRDRAERAEGRHLVRSIKRRATIVKIVRAHRKARRVIVDLLDQLRGASDDIGYLTTRRDSLLALVAKLSQTTPFAEELQGWERQRAAMIAEVGTLRARVAETNRRIADACAAVAAHGARELERAMSPCSQLSAFFDGELPATIRDHLGGCPQCQRTLHAAMQIEMITPS
jgi:hypothetical protein